MSERETERETEREREILKKLNISCSIHFTFQMKFNFNLCWWRHLGFAANVAF